MMTKRGNKSASAGRGAVEEEQLPAVGKSPVFIEMLTRVRQLARSRRPVLINGPTGSGKELVARLLHSESGLTGTFVVVNCAGIPDDIADSELFGYERGAFTGADTNRMGLIVRAENGTLFLDEVAELTAPVQHKLLRFLNDGSYRPVGATQEQRVTTRVVAATNRSLEQLVEAGRFREDLYYRLKMLHLRVPGLAERGNDVVLIAQHFLDTDPDLAPRGLKLSRSARQVLREYPWKGNIRELQSALLEASFLSDGQQVERGQLEQVLQWRLPPVPDGERLLEMVPPEGIEVGELRKLAGMSNPTLFRRLKELTEQGLVARQGRGHRVRVVRCQEPEPAGTLDSERCRKVLSLLRRRGPMASRHLSDALKLPVRTLNRLMASLLEQGAVLREGHGRSISYRIPSEEDLRLTRQLRNEVQPDESERL